MKNAVIIVPGLMDRVNGISFLIKNWNKSNVDMFIHAAPWEDKEHFEPKLKNLVAQIDQLSKTYKVSLIGVSAGGSMVINAFMQRKNKVKKVINVSGRLRVGGFPSLKIAAKGRIAFKESVVLCEKYLTLFSQEDCKKIMTISPLFDGVVPMSAIQVNGALNITIPVIFHSIANIFALTVFKKKLIEFIK